MVEKGVRACQAHASLVLGPRQIGSAKSYVRSLEEPMADPQFCALCGNAIAGASQFVIEGTACDECFRKREHARARKLMPVALAALFCALVPLAVGYATIKVSNNYSS